MSTRSIVPRAAKEGSLGTQSKPWGGVYASKLSTLSRNTIYAVGDIVFCDALMMPYYLECTTAGTTAGTQPAITSTLGTDITDGSTIWNVRKFNAMIGHVQWQYTLEPGYVKLNGATVSRTTYANLWLWAQANSLTTSSNTSNTTKHLFGVGDGSTTFVLPNFVDLVLQGGSAICSIGAGLPNITGSLTDAMTGSNISLFIDTAATGAFTGRSGTYRQYPNISAAGSSLFYDTINFNASKSNSIYGSSTTVQPPAVKLIPQIKY